MPQLSSAAWEVYQRQLFVVEHGLPLWEASPETTDQEFDIGSVIYKGIQGRYCYLFNTMRPANDPCNKPFGVPEGFKQFTVPNPSLIRTWEAIKTPCLLSKALSSSNASFDLQASDPATLAGIGAGFNFVCKEESGALLLLEPPGKARYFQSKRHIVRYMRDHYLSWMSLANDVCGLDLKENELFFLSGTTKTTRWYAAAFQGEHCRDREGHIQCDLANVGTLNARISIADKTLHSSEFNYGPYIARQSIASASTDVVRASEAPSTSDPCNQCIFVHYYKLKRRWLLAPKVMQAAAGPHELPPGEDPQPESPVPAGCQQSDDSDIEEIPGPLSPTDPVDVLLNYILEHSPAEIAIGTDRDIIVLFQDTGIPHDLKSALEALSPTIDIDEDGVGTVVADTRMPDLPESAQGTSAAEFGNNPDITMSEHPEGVGENLPTSYEQLAENTENLLREPEEDPVDDSSGSSNEGSDSHKRHAVEPAELEPAVVVHTGSITALTASPDSKWVASGSDDAAIILWSTADQGLVRRMEGHTDIVRQLAFAPDSARLASAGGDGRVLVWDVQSGELVAALVGHEGAGDEDAVHDVAWAPGGARLASASDDGTVRVWDAETGVTQRVLEGHDTMVMFARFSHNGRWLATGGADYKCRLWHAETGALHKTLEGHKGIVWTAAFDPDDNRIATASDDGSVRIWKIETGEELVILHEHQGPVWAVQFSEDGKQILSGSSDSTVKVCDSYSGENLMTMDKHESMVNVALFSPDGKYIASASSDNTVRLWNRSDGSAVVTFNEHNDKVTHAIFSPDGETLSSGSHDGAIRIRVLDQYIEEQH